MKLFIKFFLLLFIGNLFIINTFSYNLTNRDYKTIDRVENKIYNIIDNNDKISAEKVTDFLKKYAKLNRKYNRIGKILKEIINNIEYKYLIGNYINYKNKYKLLPPINKEIYFGAFPDFGGPEDIVTEEKIENFELLAGKNIGWAYFSDNWINGINYPKNSIHTISNKGVIPFVRLMPRSDLEQYHREDTYSMQNIIDGQFDEELRQRAKDAKEDFEETQIPLLIDFAVEMNGDWFSWNGKYNGKNTKDNYGNPNYYDGAERYRDAYRHIIDIFREENVNHVTWFFHADIYSNPQKKWNKAKYYYPGDEYIDWLGVSLYGPQNPEEDYWDTFSEILESRYKSILEISKNKPIALLEFGVTDNHPLGQKSEWLENAFETIINNSYLNFQAISYWHENWEEDDDLWATLRIDSSTESLNMFQKYAKNSRFISETIFSNFSNSIPQANLLFKSNFEEGVYIEQASADDGGIWWQQIKGSDVNDFSWPINILGHNGILQLIVSSRKNINNYIKNNIETVIGIDNKPTKALHQTIIKKQYEYTQDPYIIYTNGNEVENLYTKYSLKFPENIAELLGENGRAVINEFKTTGDYRLALYIYSDQDKHLYWYMHGDNVVLDGVPYEEFWYRENKEIQVPVGEWFDLEIFWHRSTENDGRVWWAINGETISDYNGITKLIDPINAIMIFTNYASNPIHQWIDNIEIWDNLPNK